MLYVVDVVVIALVAAGLITLMRANRRRRLASARSWAADHGMQYQPVDPALAELYPGDPFDTGVYRNVENVVTGTVAEHPVRAFDVRITYSTSVPSLRLKRAVLKVVARQLPATLPTLKVRHPTSLLPERSDGGLTRVSTGDGAFDDKYRVFTDDESFARDVLDTGLRSWMLSADGRGWLIRGNEMVTWRFGKSYSGGNPEAALSLAPYLEAVIEKLPAVVWQKAGLRIPPG